LASYGIHQIEPVVALMGPGVKRVQFTGTEKWPAYICEYTDGRRVHISHHGWECPFQMAVDYSGGTTEMISIESDFFAGFIRDMVDFFRTREIKVPHEETVAIIATLEAAVKASKQPGSWIAL
jgi:hypothetical protein